MTQETKHTPGLWPIVSNLKHTPAPWRVANGMNIVCGDHQIARVWMCKNGEGKANAQLIAAAPEMAAEISRLKKQVSDLLQENDRLKARIARGKP